MLIWNFCREEGANVYKYALLCLLERIVRIQSNKYNRNDESIFAGQLYKSDILSQ